MKHFKIGVALALSLALASCGTTPLGSAPAEKGDVSPQNFQCPEPYRVAQQRLPSDPSCPDPDPTDPGVVLSPDTRILDGAVQSYDDASGILVVADTFVTSAYAVGNIVIGGVTPGTPVGVPPRRVTGISSSGSDLILSTQAASLTDAVQEGQLTFTQALTVSDIAEETTTDVVAYALQGKSMLSALAVSCTKVNGNIYSKDFTKDLGSVSRLNGCARVGLDTTLNLNISRFTLQSFEASVKLSEEAQLELELASYSDNKEWELGRIRFNPITAWLGPVPIVLTPYIAFAVGINGTVSANLSYKITQDVSYKAGVQYVNGSLSRINQKTTNFTGPVPTMSNPVTGTAKAYLDVKPGLNFWSTVILATADGDVTGTVRGYVKADVNTARSPVWQITAGPQFCIGYKAKLDVLFGIISNSWSGNQCGNELRSFEWNSGTGNGTQTPSPFSTWNSVVLNFTDVYGDIEIYKTDPRTGVESLVVRLAGNNTYDITPYIDASDDTDFRIGSVSKKPGTFSSYQRSIDMNVLGNNVLIWDGPRQSCSSCHSGTVYNFTVNKSLATFKPW
ncbi:hypothetical protein E7T06_08590 [Deinococcus sp. Arct2-2]|uniref:hypothetical protein n=1 Tax=Deinococcus sp. Arct2-2 TaxID=2568653 RepID=UPI0010A51C72|nr:hypothetical protein [Deinococcus sp. Arct2-2]THF70232.1 hypothetical protein E7T06_08590 [Deinococcus sp. Arct2-2]